MGIKIKKIIKKIQLKRTTVLLLVFILMAFVLVRQLFDLQIIQGENYINEFQTRTTKTRVLKSTRGNIYDKNNKLIASNVLSYSLTFEDNGTYDSTRQKNLTLNGVAYKVLKILSENGDQLSNSFHIKLDKDGNYAFDVKEGFTLSRFKADIYGHALIDDLTEDEAAATAEDMVAYLSGNKGFSIVLYGDDAYTDEELKKYGLPKELTKQEVLDIAIMRYELSTNSFQNIWRLRLQRTLVKVQLQQLWKTRMNSRESMFWRILYVSMLMTRAWDRFSVIPDGHHQKSWKVLRKKIRIIPMMRL